ncbi:MAG: hypothetical protein AAFP19_04455, partial [Bacteroidota bacterium]
YFSVPNGFALVTRIEQINADASPKANPDRWELSTKSPSSFTLRDYLRALFTAPEGRFRVLAFIFTDQSFVQSRQSINKKEAVQWLSKGANRLPKSYRTMPFTADYACTAMIYEFSKVGNDEPIFADPSIHQGRTHLIRSDLWDFLEAQKN